MKQPRKVRALRLAERLAYKIYRHQQAKGWAPQIPKRLPKTVKRYLRMILRANGIKSPKFKNPPSKTHCKKCRLPKQMHRIGSKKMLCGNRRCRRFGK